MARQRDTKTFKTRNPRRGVDNGEVSMAQLRAEVEAGCRHFYSKPWRSAPLPSAIGQGALGRKYKLLGLDEAVRVAVAIGEPQRGALKRIADSNQLDYRLFMKAYYKARRENQRREAA
jgi:hypothetical protein